MIGRQPARRHDAVDVRMADEGLAPRVENAQDADLGAQVARIRGHLTQRGRTRLEEQDVELCGVAIAERQQRMRQREDDMHVRHVEELALPGREPPGTRLRLALRAVPIAARVIGDGLVSAGVTPIEVTPKCGGATARDCPEDRSLLCAQPRMLLEESVALRVEDIGHLHGRPAHDGGGFRKRRDRRTTGGGVTCNCSSGWATRAGGVARGGDTPSCATGRRGRVRAESSAGRSPLPIDGWRTSAAACAG